MSIAFSIFSMLTLRHLNWRANAWKLNNRYNQTNAEYRRERPFCDRAWWTYRSPNCSPRRPLSANVLGRVESTVSDGAVSVPWTTNPLVAWSSFKSCRWYTRTVSGLAEDFLMQWLSSWKELFVSGWLRRSWKTISLDDGSTLGLQGKIPRELFLIAGESWISGDQ